MFKSFRLSRRAVVAACAALQCTWSAAHAANYFVAPCGNDAWVGVQPGCAAPLGPKRTIQAAIDVASSGDTIFVLPGTYFETIDMDGKAIKLTSSGGALATIIDGNGDGPVVLCNSLEGPGTIIEGFTIRNGEADEIGGGMLIALASPTVRDCRFVDNVATNWGGGIYAAQSSATIDNCDFIGNAAFLGGGAYFDYGSPTIVDCSFTGNSAGLWGGGLVLRNSVNATLSDTVFHTNDSNVGAGLYLTFGNAVVDGCTFDSNVALHSGGGAHAYDMDSLLVEDCHFEWNVVATEADGVGGGLKISQGPAELLGCSFENNSAPIGGGALGVANSDPLLVQQCTFANNQSMPDGEGGAVNLFHSEVTFLGCGFAGNNAHNGGAVVSYDSNVISKSNTFQSNESSNVGGGVYFQGEGRTFAAFACDFLGNAATAGGGVRFGSGEGSIELCTFDGNVASLVGGGISSGGNNVDVRDTLFTGNQAGGGGGMAGGRLILRCTFDGNTAERGAGALSTSNSSHPLFANCELTNNTATEYGSALAIHTGATARMMNCIVHHNTAPAGRGAIHEADYNGSLDIVNSVVANNTGGGIIIDDPDTQSTVSNSIVWGNTNGGQFAGDLPMHVRHCCIQGGGVPGVGNISATPLFIGALVGDYRVQANSPCVDAGHNWLVLTDVRDADGDGDDAELFPFDFDGNSRITDDASVRAGACHVTSAVVDIGPFESAGDPVIAEPRLGDMVDSATFQPPSDGVVDGADLAILLGAWGPCEEACCPADLDLSGEVDGWDLALLLGSWG